MQYGAKGGPAPPVAQVCCDRLDARATDIYTACSFQDLTGQRTSKVVKTLAFLENRVLAMIEIWGLEEIDVQDRKVKEEQSDSHLLNGPARRGEGVDQSEVDQMISTNQAEGPEIEGEAAGQGDMDQFDPIEAAPPQPPAPSSEPEQVSATAAEIQAAPATAVEPAPVASQALAGEVMAGDFSPPANLEIDELDETKKQALFS